LTRSWWYFEVVVAMYSVAQVDIGRMGMEIAAYMVDRVVPAQRSKEDTAKVVQVETVGADTEDTVVVDSSADSEDTGLEDIVVVGTVDFAAAELAAVESPV
jgi:hypothetical protein